MSSAFAGLESPSMMRQRRSTSISCSCMVRHLSFRSGKHDAN